MSLRKYIIMSLWCLVKQRSIVLLGTALLGTNAGSIMAQQPVANNGADFFHAALDVKGKGVCKEENGILPRNDITGRNNNLAPSGKVTLGGGWITAMYEGLSIKELAPGAMDNTPRLEYTSLLKTNNKEEKRTAQRRAYRPVMVEKIN